jgi:cytidylate kinase
LVWKCDPAITGNATIAEALSIRKEYAKAGELYRSAVTMALAETGSHESTWKQARRLLEKLGPTNAERAPVKMAFIHLSKAE